MAASDSTVFPPKGVAYRCYGFMKYVTNGNPMTGGVAALAATISKDGGAFVSTTNAAVESPANSGLVYVDLTATEMTANSVALVFTSSNEGAIYATPIITTDGVAQVQSGLATAAELTSAETAIIAAQSTSVWNAADYGDSAGRATTLGGQIAQIWRYLFNQNRVDKNAQTQTLYRDDSATVLVAAPITANSQTTTKGKLS